MEENETWINFGSKPENLKSFKNYLDEGTVWMILKNSQSNFLKIYINAESVNDLGIENYFDENISLIGTGKHEIIQESA